MNESSVAFLKGVSEDSETFFSDALKAIRTHLGMSVAFISEFKDGRRFFREVDGEPGVDLIRAGMSDPLDESVCALVVSGQVPQWMPDASADPVAGKIDAVRALAVRAHISVPIVLANNTLHGTICCFSLQPDHSLNERDASVMRAFAEVIAKQLDKGIQSTRLLEEAKSRIERVISERKIDIVFQPMFNFSSGVIAGFEALSRFGASPVRTPDLWFAEAARVGLGVDLELHAIELALQGLDHLPREVYVSVNASPSCIESGRLSRVLAGLALERVVVEITEHEAVREYSALLNELAPLRQRGLRIAIDDAGAGYACFNHILSLSADIVKLDISITRDIHLSRQKRALAAALCRFSEEIGCKIVAEGVESEVELETLKRLGFHKAQGYYLGRPMPLQASVALCGAG